MKPVPIEPHGAFSVRLIEDAEAAGNRIFELTEHGPKRNRTFGLTGEELKSLATWWSREKRRKSPLSESP